MAKETKLVYVDTRKLSRSQRRRIKELQKECFSRVSRREIAECFIAKGFGWVLACQGDRIMAQIELLSRRMRFDGRSILVGRVGGTCVTISARHRSMGSRLVKEAMKTLKEKKCEVACLNANARDYPSSGLYRKVGFRLMQRPISFTDVKLIAERFHLLESTTSFREVEK